MAGNTRGTFIVLEGIEGAGKTTQIPLLRDFLVSRGRRVVTTLEPGGTDVGRHIREVILDPRHKAMTSTAELLLYHAARAQHVEEVVRPQLENGAWILCDRFSDSTLAYQGYGRGLDRKLLSQLDEISTGGLVPDLAIILDLEVEAGLRRNVQAGKHDRMELESVEFHRRVREGFHKLADEKPYAVLVSGAGEALEVHTRIRAVVQERLCP